MIMARSALPDNPIIMQAFYWEMGTGGYADHFPEERDLWRLLPAKAAEWKQWGITAAWLPPAHKGMTGTYDVGYSSYDLYDLGEFDQKGTVRTKYGTKEELVEAVQVLREHGIGVYYDAVLNHLMGADQTETLELSSRSPDKPGEEVEVWSHFTFPGRQGRYSDFQWHWWHFNGTDFDQRSGDTGIFLFKDKQWDATCHQSDSYLMGMDYDYEHEEVQEQLIRWGVWLVETLDVDGFRLDALKHMGCHFINTWLQEVQRRTDKKLFFVGEAWLNDAEVLKNYFDSLTAEELHVFDFPLRDSFRELSDNDMFSMRRLQHCGLVNQEGYAERAVTFVENHDSQRDGEIMGLHRYKYHAYAYILLRERGLPKVYWKDIYAYNMKDGVAKLMEARKRFAHGPGYEWEDACDDVVYAYVREGLENHPETGCVLLLAKKTETDWTSRHIRTQRPNTQFVDWTGNQEHTVTTDDGGWGEFGVACSEGRGWSVWVPKPQT